MELLLRATFIAIGLAHQGVARLVPFREQPEPRQLWWDLAGMVFGAACAAGYALLIGGPLIEWLSSHDGVARWYARVDQWPWVVGLGVNLVVADLSVYWAHRLLHHRALWHTHAWHHSPRHVWWLSGLRASPVHVVFTMLPSTVGFLLCPIGPGGAVLTGLIVFRMANQHWLHSNIAIPGARTLEWLFVTPRFHFVHHSADVRLTNTNYGFVFTLWDRLFGTFVDPETVPAGERLGLDYDNGNLRLMLGLPPGESRPQPEWEGSIP